MAFQEATLESWPRQSCRSTKRETSQCSPVERCRSPSQTPSCTSNGFYDPEIPWRRNPKKATRFGWHLQGVCPIRAPGISKLVIGLFGVVKRHTYAFEIAQNVIPIFIKDVPWFHIVMYHSQPLQMHQCCRNMLGNRHGFLRGHLWWFKLAVIEIIVVLDHGIRQFWNLFDGNQVWVWVLAEQLSHARVAFGHLQCVIKCLLLLIFKSQRPHKTAILVRFIHVDRKQAMTKVGHSNIQPESLDDLLSWVSLCLEYLCWPTLWQEACFIEAKTVVHNVFKFRIKLARDWKLSTNSNQVWAVKTLFVWYGV